jgi:hypothetical protein
MDWLRRRMSDAQFRGVLYCSTLFLAAPSVGSCSYLLHCLLLNLSGSNSFHERAP